LIIIKPDQLVTSKPKVSVILPVYNGEEFLREAVDSILNQTFTDFEFIIIDDGSRDSSADIIKSYDDYRIRFVSNEKNLGLIKTLNKGLGLAQGKYIARMDADDISLPSRLEKQVAFMEDHHEIGVCGTWFKIIGQENNEIKKTPLNHDDICARMFCISSICHASVTIRKEVLDKNNLFYDLNYLHCEDYKLWFDMAKVSKLANIPIILYLYRQHGAQVSKLPKNRMGIINMLVEGFLGRPLTEHEKKCQEALHFFTPHHDLKIMKDVDEWVDFLKNHNSTTKAYKEPMFSDTLDKTKRAMYLRCFRHEIRNKKRLEPGLFLKIFFSGKRYYLYMPKNILFKLVVKCLIRAPNKQYREPEVS